MVVEVVAGSFFGSMALLADGWHMGTHVAAFLITIYAYRYARQHAQDPQFSFGTGKVSVLGGFASAVTLTVVALMMVVESIERFFTPEIIQFNAALGVAIIGLLVNLASALLLKDGHDHHHTHEHSHHHDHNLRAAYLHVIADALTSLLAIAALLLGKYYGWNWSDPLMGVMGAVIITRWGFALIKQTGPILLDGAATEKYRTQIKASIEADADNRISDLHLWHVAENQYATIIAIVTDMPQPIQHYKNLLQPYPFLAHITIEVHRCEDSACQANHSSA